MFVTDKTTVQFLWQGRSVHEQFRTGVSLHSHTMYSEESLGVIPRYTAKLPFVAAAIRHHEAEYQQKKGGQFDFSRAFWTPPLAPRQAFRLEEKQIQRRFQLPALVSITDHDDIRAGTLLRVMDRFQKVPISTEWTMPFGPTFFHLGIHNLPPTEAPGIMEQLASFTAKPEESQLAGILSMLNSYPDTLLILNHPLWDEKKIGMGNHMHVLGRLLERHGRLFHALELNGLRSWAENQQVMRLGRQTRFPLVSGGDRHGLEPNAILNLSQATELVEFIHEVRYARRSHVVFMPQYREPYKLRLLQTMADVLRDYPQNFIARSSWTDRIFYRFPGNPTPSPISVEWPNGGPLIIKQFIAAIRLLEWRGIQSALRVALNDRSIVWSDRELAV
jgi:hypothetical protein